MAGKMKMTKLYGKIGPAITGLLIAMSLGHAHAQESLLEVFSKDQPVEYFITTDDGWTLSLFRYMPDKVRNGKPPVILCHGFNFNNYMWDLDKKHSLARYLKAKGYDTWAVNLRGSGDSSKPAMSDIRSISKMQVLNIPKTLMRMPSNVNKFDWSIDDHIHKDLPAIINFVKSQAKSPDVTWIGHSMGGMVMYGYLATENLDNIRNFVSVGSMINVKQPPSPTLGLVASQKPAANASLLINTTVAYQIRNLTLGAIKLPWEELFYNKDNMDDLTAIQMFRLTIDDTSPGVISQFADMIKTGEFKTIDQSFSYTGNISRIKVPILFVAGIEDKLGTLETMMHAYETVASDDKEIVIFSKENGYSADYGHCDLLLGKNSQEEVYSVIADWLDKR